MSRVAMTIHIAASLNISHTVTTHNPTPKLRNMDVECTLGGGTRFCFQSPHRLILRVQVPNCHILSKIVTYISILNPNIYLIIIGSKEVPWTLNPTP